MFSNSSLLHLFKIKLFISGLMFCCFTEKMQSRFLALSLQKNNKIHSGHCGGKDGIMYFNVNSLCKKSKMCTHAHTCKCTLICM